MKIIVKLSVVYCLLLFSASLALAQIPDGQKTNLTDTKQDKSEYKEIVEKVKKDDLTVDFVKLRAAYLDWINDECNQTDAPNRDEMVKAFEAKDYTKAAQLAEIVLEYEFTNRGLHLATANAYKETKNAEKEKFYTEVAQKLLQAILTSGDGKTPLTAYKVHTIREEYVIMRELGYKVSVQSLVSEKGCGMLDVLEGTNKEGKTGSFYFDINSFFGGGKSIPCKTNTK